MSAEQIIDIEPWHDESWQITDLSGANWALKKITKARMKQVENKAFVEAEIAKLQSWLADANDVEQSTINFMESKLIPFAEHQLEGSKKKSLSLPYGTIGFRLKTNTVKDNKTILDYLHGTYPELVRKKVVEEPDLVTLKKYCSISDQGDLVSPDGEIIPGYNVQTTNEFYTKTA